MPKRVTMRLRNSRVAPRLLTLLLLCVASAAQNPTPSAEPPRSSQPAPPPASSTPQGSAPSRGQEPGVENGGFVFHAEVQEVVLHATVIDNKQRMITSL